MKEGLRFAARGEKRGYALDLYQTDISIEGPNPVSPSGGNSGNGAKPIDRLGRKGDETARVQESGGLVDPGRPGRQKPRFAKEAPNAAD